MHACMHTYIYIYKKRESATKRERERKERERERARARAQGGGGRPPGGRLNEALAEHPLGASGSDLRLLVSSVSVAGFYGHIILDCLSTACQ
jgi:hypothetical protein